MDGGRGGRNKRRGRGSTPQSRSPRGRGESPGVQLSQGSPSEKSEPALRSPPVQKPEVAASLKTPVTSVEIKTMETPDVKNTTSETLRDQPEQSASETPKSKIEPEQSASENSTPKVEPEQSASEASTPKVEPEQSASETSTPKVEPEQSTTETLTPKIEPEETPSETSTLTIKDDPSETPSVTSTPKVEAPEKSSEASISKVESQDSQETPRKESPEIEPATPDPEFVTPVSSPTDLVRDHPNETKASPAEEIKSPIEAQVEVTTPVAEAKIPSRKNSPAFTTSYKSSELSDPDDALPDLESIEHISKTPVIVTQAAVGANNGGEKEGKPVNLEEEKIETVPLSQPGEITGKQGYLGGLAGLGGK
ncbi:unnamed protein product, partial [Allacma fusca]